MTTPKNPEEILEEWNSSNFAFYSENTDAVYVNEERLQNFLRSSMASLLLYMAERMPKYQETVKIDADKVHELKGDFREWNEQTRGFNIALDACRTLLTNEARKITEV